MFYNIIGRKIYSDMNEYKEMERAEKKTIDPSDMKGREQGVGLITMQGSKSG